VELRDGVARICIAAHGHEGEPARFSGEAILNQHDFGHGARLGKEILEVGFRGVERKVPHVEFVTHFWTVRLTALQNFGDGARSSVSRRH